MNKFCMGTHTMPSFLHGHIASAFGFAKSGAEGVRTSTHPQLPHGRPHGCSPLAAAITLQLDAVSHRPIANLGTMGRSCNPHLTCHMARAHATAVAPLLDAASLRPVTNPGTVGGVAPVPQAPQHPFSGAASIAALCRYCMVTVLELQLLHFSWTQ